jgi:hypothetical protein
MGVNIPLFNIKNMEITNMSDLTIKLNEEETREYISKRFGTKEIEETTVNNNEMKQDLLDTYDIDDLTNIALHGCSGGSAGCHIYYNDTCKWYDLFSSEIWGLINSMAKEMGQTPLELIASFNSNKSVMTDIGFKNFLCWFAIEETARGILNDNNIEI